MSDCYSEKCNQSKKYSYRKFAAEAGFTNPGYLNDVIKNRRQLSKAAIDKIIKVFEINPSDEDFFRLLVDYGQAKKTTLKDELYKKTSL